MQVAAAFLSALAHMTPDPAWTPPLGVLFIRILTAPWGDQIHLGFADEPPGEGLLHYRSIARVRNWLASSDFGGNFECCKGNLDTSHAAPVVRRLATEDDVRMVLLLWDPDERITRRQWLAEVLRTRGLSDECKVNIAETAARLGIAPAVGGET